MPWHGHCIKGDNFMKTNKTLNSARKSTYALLVKSEEKERSLFETFIYGLLVVSAVIGIWQFAHMRIATPFANNPPAVSSVVSLS
jgi:hypothetical protein